MRGISKLRKNPDRIQKSYYVNAQLNKALKFMAAEENKTENEIIVDALNSFVPKKFFEMAQK